MEHHKDPTHIIEAASGLPDVELSLIGTGPLHLGLIDLARRLQCEARCHFVPALPNDKVLIEMSQADVFVFNQLYLGISKAIIEAALSGLPIVVNEPTGTDELEGDWLIRVNDSKEGYLEAMKRLTNQNERELLGRRAFAHAREHWAPELMESKTAQLYVDVISKSKTERNQPEPDPP